jgi:ABC-type branched-subunit amino acid transport system substrate-binding protein
MKRLCLISLVIALLVVLVGGLNLTSCGPGGPTLPAAINICVVRSLSGPLSSIGNYAFGPVMELWVDQVNAAGGIYVAEYGKKLPVVLNIQDDESDFATMVSLLNSMVSSRAYDFVFAPVGTDFLQAAATICNTNEYILLGTEGGCTSIMDMLDELPYLFGVLNFADYKQLPVLADLLQAVGATTAAISWIENADGWGYLAVAEEEFQARGIDISMNQSHPLGAFNFSAVLTAASTANGGTPVDVFCAFTYPDQVFELTYQAWALNISFNAFVVGLGGGFMVYRDFFGDAIDGVIFLGAWNQKQDDLGVTAGAQDFYDLFTTYYAEEIAAGPVTLDMWGGLYYWAGLQCFQQAIERAGTLDNDAVRAELAAAWPGSSTNPPFDTGLGPTWFTNPVGNPVGAGGGLLAVECHPGEIGQWQYDAGEEMCIPKVIGPTDKATMNISFPKEPVDWRDPEGLLNFTDMGSELVNYTDKWGHIHEGWAKKVEITVPQDWGIRHVNIVNCDNFKYPIYFNPPGKWEYTWSRPCHKLPPENQLPTKVTVYVLYGNETKEIGFTAMVKIEKDGDEKVKSIRIEGPRRPPPE